jgi:hypothetical protein
VARTYWLSRKCPAIFFKVDDGASCATSLVMTATAWLDLSNGLLQNKQLEQGLWILLIRICKIRKSTHGFLGQASSASVPYKSEGWGSSDIIDVTFLL